MAMFSLRSKFKISDYTPYIVTLLAVISRMVPHAPNFTATGAASLYSGRYFRGKTRFIVPFIILLITDAFLGFHAAMPFVYFCFGINIILGIWISKKPTVWKIAGITLLSSLIFFVVTNFGVWFVGGLYPKTIQGLAVCYANAIPFARNTFLGDLVFVSAMFGITEIVNRYQNKSIVDYNERRGLWPVQAKR